MLLVVGEPSFGSPQTPASHLIPPEASLLQRAAAEALAHQLQAQMQLPARGVLMVRQEQTHRQAITLVIRESTALVAILAVPAG
jgi:hypothetical protein